jgi:hypothetical protein
MQKKVEEKPKAAAQAPEPAPAPAKAKEPTSPPKTMRVVGVNAATGQAVFEEVEDDAGD